MSRSSKNMNSKLLSRCFDILGKSPSRYNQNILRKRLNRVLHDIKGHPAAFAFPADSESCTQCRFKSSGQQLTTGLKVKTMQEVNSDSQPHQVQDLLPESVKIPVGEGDGWLDIGLYSVFAWSISGVESCIVVKSEDLQVVFDLGVAVKESVKAPTVFITHGHIDHIGGLSSHISKRSLFGMKPARYFVPPHLVEPLKTVVQAHHLMAEKSSAAEKVNILPMSEGEKVQLNSRYFVKSFPTLHRVPSQGYILYKEEKTLKPEYRGMEGFEVASLHRAGKEIHDLVVTPEIAYTGDTLVDVFNNPPSDDLLRVKLLITEATFLDENEKRGGCMIDKARARGHTHLVELAQNANLFENVGHILLVHFSNKYSPKYICDAVRDRLPPQLKSKVTPATVAAATKPKTYFS